MSTPALIGCIYLAAAGAVWSLFVPRAVRAIRDIRRPQVDAAFVRHVQAELKDYGHGIADYYDKGDPA